jgi:hypothetical protein
MPLSSMCATFFAAAAAVTEFVPFDVQLVEAIGLGVGSLTTPIAGILRRRRGRPRKFAAPSRAITLTLPEAVLESLSKIDPDPSRAIVHLASRKVAANGKPPAELTTFGRRAIITVKPTATLTKRTGIDLVPLPDGRALLSFDQPRSVEDLELAIYDALEDPTLSAEDRQVFESIGAILKDARRSQDVTLRRQSIIVLEGANGSRMAKPRPGKNGERR